MRNIKTGRTGSRAEEGKTMRIATSAIHRSVYTYRLCALLAKSSRASLDCKKWYMYRSLPVFSVNPKRAREWLWSIHHIYSAVQFILKNDYLCDRKQCNKLLHEFPQERHHEPQLHSALSNIHGQRYIESWNLTLGQNFILIVKWLVKAASKLRHL